MPKNTLRTTAKVREVIDGDTIKVEINGEIFSVRYIGIDTPEITGNALEQYGKEATRKNRDLVEGKIVTLVKDVSEVDIYDRLLRYVFVGDKFVNYELVSQGYANVLTYSPDVACSGLFTSIEREARKKELGLWAPIPVIQPPAQPPAQSPKQSGNCDPSYPDVCLVMGIGDYDCAGGSGNGPNYVSGPIRVLPPDPFDLDRNNNGWGCER